MKGARTLKPGRTAAELIADSEKALARSAALAEDAVTALFPVASVFEADLAALASLPSAKVGVRDRCRRLALIVAREMEGIAQLQGGKA